jgi:hypothetical protein
MSLGGQPTQQYVPPDLQGFRGQQIGLLQALLGMPTGGQQQGGGGPGAGAFPWLGGGQQRGAGQAGVAQGAGMVQGGDVLTRLGSFFGDLGTPTNGLQRQATGGIEQFLNQPAPEQRAMDVSMPALQGILNGKPGEGIMNSLQPHFQRNLDSANQVGGRFGSGNAILRSRAVDDFNMLGAQAAQQGQQTQLQAAQMLNLLASSAGNNPFQRLMGAYGVGQQNFQNADLETQRRLQLLGGLLGTAQGLAFNQPVIAGQSGGGWGGLLGTLAGSFLGPIGGAVGGAVGQAVTGGKK